MTLTKHLTVILTSTFKAQWLLHAPSGLT